MWHFASDLHLGHSSEGDRAVQRLAEHLSQNGTQQDVLVLCGDYGNDDRQLGACLELFSSFHGRKFAIPGNHDIWVPLEGSRTSIDRYRDLPCLFRAHGFHWLDGDVIDVDGIALVGAMGWYDASFRDMSLGIEDLCYEQKSYRGLTGQAFWNDALYARWGADDEAVSEWQLSLLRAALQRASSFQRMVVATHHLPTQKMLIQPRFIVPKHWRFANAFLGSERMGELLERQANLDLVVSGHVHFRRQERIGRATYLTIGSEPGKRDLIQWDGTSVHRKTFSGA